MSSAVLDRVRRRSRLGRAKGGNTAACQDASHDSRRRRSCPPHILGSQARILLAALREPNGRRWKFGDVAGKRRGPSANQRTAGPQPSQQTLPRPPPHAFKPPSSPTRTSRPRTLPKRQASPTCSSNCPPLHGHHSRVFDSQPSKWRLQCVSDANGRNTYTLPSRWRGSGRTSSFCAVQEISEIHAPEALIPTSMSAQKQHLEPILS